MHWCWLKIISNMRSLAAAKELGNYGAVHVAALAHDLEAGEPRRARQRPLRPPDVADDLLHLLQDGGALDDGSPAGGRSRTRSSRAGAHEHFERLDHPVVVGHAQPQRFGSYFVL